MIEPKRILFAIDDLSGGGAEKVVLTLIEALQQLGHQPYLLTLGTRQDYEIPEDTPHLTVPQLSGVFRKLAGYRRHAAKIDQQLSATWPNVSFDLIVSNLHRCDRTLHYCRDLEHWNCLHKPLSPAFLGHRRGLERWWKCRKVRAVYNGGRWIGVSQGILDDLQQVFDAKPVNKAVIHNPFDIEYIQRLSREQNPLADQDYLIHVGRFHREKRHDRLLAAYKASNVESRLVLVGQGDEQLVKTQIDALGLANRVTVLGFQPNPYPLIAGARALLLSSEYEGLGNVLVEALICGTPAVSVDCPTGPREILTGDLSHWLVPPDDVNTFAKVICKVIASPPIIEPRHYLGFSSKVVAEAYVSLCGKY